MSKEKGESLIPLYNDFNTLFLRALNSEGDGSEYVPELTRKIYRIATRFFEQKIKENKQKNSFTFGIGEVNLERDQRFQITDVKFSYLKSIISLFSNLREYNDKPEKLYEYTSIAEPDAIRNMLNLPLQTYMKNKYCYSDLYLRVVKTKDIANKDIFYTVPQLHLVRFVLNFTVDISDVDENNIYIKPSILLLAERIELDRHKYVSARSIPGESVKKVLSLSDKINFKIKTIE
ncbi:MAG: hypothetical protein QXU74_04150 [Candidatus Aenigmatarchaeota archaeon]